MQAAAFSPPWELFEMKLASDAELCFIKISTYFVLI